MRGLWRAAAAALVCALVAADLEEKRAELSQVPFVMGSRYGRSPAVAPRVMSPRNDRFFMGSRYGKRSMLPPAPPRAPPDPPAPPAASAALVCEFTGVAALYRCERRGATSRYQHYARRSEEDREPSGEGEEQ